MRWPWFRRKREEAASTSPYFILGGRKVLIDASYMLPADITEGNRLDFQHIMLRNFLKTNYLAPIRQPQSILDVACGTGRWGAELAQQFPHASVVGIDINPPPETNPGVTLGQAKPAENYVFVQGDITQPLPFQDNSFDFVHMRLVFMALPLPKWLPLIQELRRVTRPGGWVELLETTWEARVAGAQQYVEWVQTLSRSRGIDLMVGQQIGTFLKQSGIKNVQEIALEIPVGPWGGRIGKAMLTDIMAGAQGVEAPIVHLAKMATKEQFQAALTAMNDGFTRQHGATQSFYITFGQK